MLRYASVLILAMATAAPALAQPMSLTASVAVTWITDTYATDVLAKIANLGDPSGRGRVARPAHDASVPADRG